MMSHSPQAKSEARLAYAFLLPTLLVVFSIVLVPVIANFWISFKTVELSDLRPPKPIVKIQVSKWPKKQGDSFVFRYRIRNSSQKFPLKNIMIRHQLPDGMLVKETDSRCSLLLNELRCVFDNWPAKYREKILHKFIIDKAFKTSKKNFKNSVIKVSADTDNILTNFNFTLKNYVKILTNPEFFFVLKTTFLYTLLGTLGSLFLGLFAAQLLNQRFTGRGFLRGLFLFPYVAPVIAVAFTWVLLLDPFSGTLNTMLVKIGFLSEPLNLFGQRYVLLNLFGFEMKFPLALSTVIAFESWRYFPLAFLFILARLQAIPNELYEAAKIDGASPIQQFLFITLPQISGIISVMFLLRFIWTFNKFDDIFLLTGGNAGTRTLTVDVYEQGFALADLGAGSAVAVIIFGLLSLFMILYFRFLPLGEEE
ncbi:MAG: transporter [Deltaproteobacteria bacterium]|nr:transporter [Deltaproteobacteria bacterium]